MIVCQNADSLIERSVVPLLRLSFGRHCLIPRKPRLLIVKRQAVVCQNHFEHHFPPIQRDSARTERLRFPQEFLKRGWKLAFVFSLKLKQRAIELVTLMLCAA